MRLFSTYDTAASPVTASSCGEGTGEAIAARPACVAAVRGLLVKRVTNCDPNVLPRCNGRGGALAESADMWLKTTPVLVKTMAHFPAPAARTVALPPAGHCPHCLLHLVDGDGLPSPATCGHMVCGSCGRDAKRARVRAFRCLPCQLSAAPASDLDAQEEIAAYVACVALLGDAREVNGEEWCAVSHVVDPVLSIPRMATVLCNAVSALTRGHAGNRVSLGEPAARAMVEAVSLHFDVGSVVSAALRALTWLCTGTDEETVISSNVDVVCAAMGLLSQSMTRHVTSAAVCMTGCGLTRVLMRSGNHANHTWLITKCGVDVGVLGAAKLHPEHVEVLECAFAAAVPVVRSGSAEFVKSAVGPLVDAAVQRHPSSAGITADSLRLHLTIGSRNWTTYLKESMFPLLETFRGSADFCAAACEVFQQCGSSVDQEASSKNKCFNTACELMVLHSASRAVQRAGLQALNSLWSYNLPHSYSNGMPYYDQTAASAKFGVALPALTAAIRCIDDFQHLWYFFLNSSHALDLPTRLAGVLPASRVAEIIDANQSMFYSMWCCLYYLQQHGWNGWKTAAVMDALRRGKAKGWNYPADSSYSLGI